MAEEAGVSTATVSRTLSGRGPVNDATQQRVLLAAERLNYLPSAAAQSLRTERAMIIGVLVPDLGNPVFVPFLRGVQHVAQSCGYSVLVVDAQRSIAIEHQALDRLRAHGVDALVLAGPARDAARVEELRRAGVVVMDPDRVGSSGASLIDELEQPGTWEMCETLAELGHRRVAYVSREKVPGRAGHRRLRAMSHRSETLGVEIERVVLGRRDSAGIGALVADVVRRPEPVSALVCSTHGLVPSLLRGLRSAGIDMPGECSFVTYGDSEWAEAYRPAISVVSLDLYAVGVDVATSGIRLLASATTPPAVGAPVADRRPLQARFLWRESIGPVPGGRARSFI